VLHLRELQPHPQRPEFWRTIRLSFVVALETIALTPALLVPTVYWVHLKLRVMRP
jgi:hypothetical protein